MLGRLGKLGRLSTLRIFVFFTQLTQHTHLTQFTFHVFLLLLLPCAIVPRNYFVPSPLMRKLSLLLGSLGGVMAGYVFSNKKLRQELMAAKDAEHAAKIIGKHLAADGEEVAKEVKKFAHEHEFDKKVAQGKSYVTKYYKKSQKDVKKMLSAGMKDAKMAMKTAKKKVGM